MIWESVGQAIAGRRRALGLTQQTLADLAGVSRGTVRNIERGVVESNTKTMDHLEKVLGWPPGTIADLLDQQPPLRPPTEVIPVEVLMVIIRVISGHNTGEPAAQEAAQAAFDTLGRTVHNATRDGALGEVDQIALLDLVDGLDAFDLPRPQIDDLCKQLEHHFTTRLPPQPRKTLQQIRLTHPGTRIHHEHLGEGTILHIHHDGAKTTADVDFGATGTRELRLRYEPYHIMAATADAPATDYNTDQDPGDQPRRSPMLEALQDNLAKLGEHANKILTDGDVVDAIITDAFGTTGLATITTLIRTGDHPLGPRERRYISDFLAAHTSTDLYQRMNDGEIFDLNRPKPK